MARSDRCIADDAVRQVSAADGAEMFYTHESNRVRDEGIELARKLDEGVAQAWLGHPCVIRIDNSTNFEQKMQRAVYAVSRRLGIETDLAAGTVPRKRKFLVTKWPEVRVRCAWRRRLIGLRSSHSATGVPGTGAGL